MLIKSSDNRFSIELEELLGHKVEKCFRSFPPFNTVEEGYKLTISFMNLRPYRYDNVFFYNNEQDALHVIDLFHDDYNEALEQH